MLPGPLPLVKGGEGPGDEATCKQAAEHKHTKHTHTHKSFTIGQQQRGTNKTFGMTTSLLVGRFLAGLGVASYMYPAFVGGGKNTWFQPLAHA